MQSYVWQKPELMHKVKLFWGRCCTGGLEWLKDEEIPEEDESQRDERRALSAN